jgi:hypothetical protein
MVLIKDCVQVINKPCVRDARYVRLISWTLRCGSEKDTSLGRTIRHIRIQCGVSVYPVLHQPQSPMDLARPAALQVRTTPILLYCDVYSYMVQASYSQPKNDFSSEIFSCLHRFLQIFKEHSNFSFFYHS